MKAHEALSGSHLEIMEGLAAGNFHHYAGIHAVRIGSMDEVLLRDLQQEAFDIIRTRKPSVVKEGKHVTGWTRPKGRVEQWSLYNNHGRTEDTSNDFSYNLRDKEEILTPYSPSIASVCAWPSVVNMRLNVIHPGSGLSPHEEHLPRRLPNNQVSMRARFHIPLWTNEQCHMLADGELFHFKVGQLYLFNNGCVHSATNDGDIHRAHLVFDMLMTSDAMDHMFDNIDMQEAFQSTYAFDKIGDADVSEWAPSNGMSEEEFNKRKLVFHP